MKKISKKEFIQNLHYLTDDGPFINKEDYQEDLNVISDVMGGHDGFVDWDEKEIFMYLIGIRDTFELENAYWFDWGDE